MVDYVLGLITLDLRWWVPYCLHGGCRFALGCVCVWVLFVAVAFDDWFAIVFVCGFVTFLSFGFVSRLFVAWFVVVRPDLLFARLCLLLFIACGRL